MSSEQPPNPIVDTFNPEYWRITADGGITTQFLDANYVKFPLSQNAQETFVAIPNISATMPPSSDSSTKIPTTAWVQSAIPSVAGFATLAGTNAFTGSNSFSLLSTCSATMPLVSDDSSVIPSTAWVQDAIDAKSGSATITDDNTSATFYPVFVSGTGTQTLYADTTTTQFSINPNTSDFNVGSTLKLTQTQVALGKSAGSISQGASSVAVGIASGTTSQGDNSVAIGSGAGSTSQGVQAVAVGNASGSANQGASATAVGRQAGQTTQGDFATAVGIFSGQTTQGISATAVGNSAGKTNQATLATAVGKSAGSTDQSSGAVAVGNTAGQTSQSTNAVAIGNAAGSTSQGTNSVAIGNIAGQTNQLGNSVAIGNGAGTTNQADNNVAIGGSAGNNTQGRNSVAIGINAGQTTQGAGSVAIGINAGQTTQGAGSVAIGRLTAQTSQGADAVAVGNGAGNATQGANSIAVGYLAGQTNQTAGSIALNASGVALNPAVAGFFVNPIRADATEQLPLQYNTTTNEVSNFNWSDLLTPTSYNPVLQSSSGSNLNSGNYSIRAGYYIQLGKLVWYEVRIGISGKGGLGSAGEDIRITLPITASSLTDLTQSLNIGNMVNTSTNIVSAFANIPSGGQDYAVFPIKETAGTTTANLQVGDISSTFQIRFGGFFFTN